MKEDNRPPRNYWAPGYYEGKCLICTEEFIGDKRASYCADCAYKFLGEQLELFDDSIIQRKVT